jgi:hypothetical protein
VEHEPPLERDELGLLPGEDLIHVATGALAGTAFAAVAVASARQTTTAADTRIHDEMRDELAGAVGDAAEAVAPAVDQAAKWWVYAPAALAAAVGVLAAPGRRRGRARSRRGGGSGPRSSPRSPRP